MRETACHFDLCVRVINQAVPNEGRMRRLQGQVVYDEPFAAIDEIPSVHTNVQPIQYVLPARLPMASWQYRYFKRGIDIVGAMLMIGLFLIPGILIALA